MVLYLYKVPNFVLNLSYHVSACRTVLTWMIRVPPQGARDYIEYSTENGRAYSTKGNYLFPIDEGEQDRLDRFHSFIVQIRQAMGSVRGLNARPIENNAVLRVLDLGCGTGIWCNEMAEY